MKLILIKLGKAFVAIKRDGFIVGGRRVLSYLRVFLKTITSFKSGDVLIITGGVGDSANYRAFNQAEELNLNRIKSEVMIQDNPFLPRFAKKFKVFIFHRTLFTPTIAKLVKKIKEQRKEIIFETDDLVFDAGFIQATDFYKQISYFEKKQYEKGVAEEILKDPYVKVCTTTTSFLKKKLEEYNKKVFIVPNKLSKNNVEICEKIIDKCHSERSEESHKIIADDINSGSFANTQDDGVIKIGYFSGTISHNKDFAVITEALMGIMEKYPQTELFLVGPLDIESKLNKFKDRIKQLPYVPRKKHFENISQVDINLAPLEVGNPFCESKSELKFFEAGILGIPTVASATQTFREAISDGIDGFVANDASEWINKLQRLILEPELRQEMGQKAREKALENYTNKNSRNEEYYNYLRSKL
jgi:glycosyltransferase involved in cell wall biosynthesis